MVLVLDTIVLLSCVLVAFFEYKLLMWRLPLEKMSTSLLVMSFLAATALCIYFFAVYVDVPGIYLCLITPTAIAYIVHAGDTLCKRFMFTT